MAIERLEIGAALADYLDAASPVPGSIAARYEAMSDHPRAMMMTHPDLGRLLALLTATTGGRSALEIGTFVGISAAWIASGLAPGGRLDSLEIDPETATDTRSWLDAEGLGGRVHVHVGPALETLAGLADGAYDLVYVDADKTAYLDYLREAARVVRRGGIVVADNLLAGGDVADPDNTEPRVEALREYARRAGAHPDLRTALLPIGDGIAVSVRRPTAS